MLDYMSPRDAAGKWGVSQRRVHTYCKTGRISGAVKMSGVWLIPQDTLKPTDPRKKNKTSEDCFDEDS